MKRSPILFARAITYLSYIQSEERMASLVKGLSQEDEDFINTILRKISYIAYHNIVDYRVLYSIEDQKEQQQYLKYFYQQPSTNYFKEKGYGLVNEYCIARDIKKFALQMNGKDVIDCGAYIGDSSISFAGHFVDSTVYALEPDKKNFKELTEVIALHHKDTQIIPLNIAVGSSDGVGYLSDEGIGSKLVSHGNEITVRSIDSLVDERGLNPGLIKRDIEGFEYYSIIGCVETIKKYKPVLFISVYHHGRDLFEIKKILDELDVGYRYTFTRRDSMTAFSDTLLVCY